nr:integrase, catalytic region, zinc finger, CCHC-type, peptidase aspartic, catalytic [Tanacetum cinerariifolium]
MYDDYFGGQPSANVENVPTVQESQVRQTSTTSTSSADNVPIPTNSSYHATNIPIPSQDVDELNPNAMVDGYTFVNPFSNLSTSAAAEASSSQNDVDEINPNVMVHGNMFFNPFANSSTSAAASSSLQNVDPSNMHTKPDISFLYVFGALCYPKNDREDIGKLGAKGDIGFSLDTLLIPVLTEFTTVGQRKSWRLWMFHLMRFQRCLLNNAVQKPGFKNPRVQNVGNQNGLIGVQGKGNQNQIRNGNLVAAHAEGNAAGQNGNQIRCYNCRGVCHYARNCTVMPRRRDVAYLQTQLLIAQKEKAEIQLQAEEYDLMDAATDLDEIEEVNANSILMANLQQASTSLQLSQNSRPPCSIIKINT